MKRRGSLILSKQVLKQCLTVQVSSLLDVTGVGDICTVI